MLTTFSNPWDAAPASPAEPTSMSFPSTSAASEPGGSDQAVRAAVAALTDVVDQVERAIPRGPSVSFAQAAHSFAAIEDASKALGRVMALLSRIANELPHDDKTVIDGLGVVEVARSSSVKFDEPLVMALLKQHAAVDPLTGEVAEAPDPVRLLDLVLRASSRSWRITDLRNIVGDAANKARDVSYGPPKLKVIR